MKIPEDIIQQVRDATDIVEIVSRYVGLKKKGKTFMGLCPFHQEKSPSFSVDPVRGFYHCFGCGEGGNVFTFLMQMEKVSFPEVVRTLAEKAGIALPERTEEDAKESKESEALYRVNELAMAFYRRCLFHTDAGKKALDYLKTRGFDASAIETFGLGYAPKRWDGLIRMAEKESVEQETLARAGLIIPGKKDGYYDRFRGRLMFPVYSPSGRIVGFGGRALKEEAGVPKYINSPESPVYRKSRILYGLYQSASEIRREDRVLLVEGYTDVLRLHQTGFPFCVASSGTALTEAQARLLLRYTKHVVLVFDGDSAGLQAALRGVDILIAQGLHVEVAPLPAGTDPDSIVRKRGPEAMSHILKETQTFIDFRLERMKSEGRLNSPADRAEAARSILATISAMRDRLERALTVKDLSEKLGIDESLLSSMIDDPGNRGEGEVVDAVKQDGERNQDEEELLYLILEDPRRWGMKIFREYDPDRFIGTETRWLARVIYDALMAGGNAGPQSLLDACEGDPRRSRFVARLISRELEPGVNRALLGLDCLMKLNHRRMQKRIDEVKEAMRQARQRGDDDSPFAAQVQSIRREADSELDRLKQAWKKDVEFE